MDLILSEKNKEFFFIYLITQTTTTKMCHALKTIVAEIYLYINIFVVVFFYQFEI